MSLIPGSPRYDANEEKYVIDDLAIQDSMVLAIENEMKNVYKTLNGVNLPAVGEEDRRMLFSAIARGILKYLDDHAGELIKDLTIDHAGGTTTEHTVDGLDLDIEVKNL